MLAQVRANILKGFESLPLLIASFIGFAAIGLGNMGLFLLFIGQAVIVPVIIELIHFVTKVADTHLSVSQLGLEPAIDFTTGSPTWATFRNPTPSYWLGQMWFLFGFLLSNAVTLYATPAESGTEDWRKIARQSKTAMLIATITLFALVATLLRYYATGSENITGIAIAVFGLGGAGAGWYQLVQLCGARTSDVFGISTQTLGGNKGGTNTVMTCAYPTTGSRTT